MCTFRSRPTTMARMVFATSALSAASLSHAGNPCLPLDLPPGSSFDFGGASSSFAIYSVELGNTGGPDPDYFDFMFYDGGVSEVGTFDLSIGDDANYATCKRCLSICLDVDQVSLECSKWIFQTEGMLTLNASPEEGVLDYSVQNLHLVESTIDPDTFVSTPVPDGVCYSTNASAVPEIFVNGFEP